MYEKYSVLNREPRFVVAEKIITPAAAEKLISLVDERGSASEWSDNPHTLEYQMANPFSKNERNVDKKDLEVLPDLFQVGQSFLRQFNRDMNNTVCEIVTGYHGFWIMKYEEGAKFSQHTDWGTGPEAIMPPVVATLGIKLNEDYEGGKLTFYSGPHSYEMDTPLYGGIGHDGFTDHAVSEVTKGTRYNLVIHYTGSVR